MDRGPSVIERGSTVTRRRFLRFAAPAVVVLVAGCQGNDGDVDSDDEDGDDDTSAGTDDDDGNGTTTAQRLEDEALAFVEYLDEGQFDRAESMIASASLPDLEASVLEAAWTDLTARRGDPLSLLGASYVGTENGVSTIVVDARFEDGPLEFVVSFLEDTDEVAGFFIPSMVEWSAPEYVDEEAFTEETVTVETPIDCDLEGMLSVPDHDDPVPGVAIVHGSGPMDRDGTAGPNRTYKELAQGLASRGVAAIRYDKRTYACDVDLANVTIDDVAIDDALAAIEVLREDERVDAGSVVVVGHSLGGTLAPKIAARDGDLAAIAMLAPAARSIPDLVVAQHHHLFGLDGPPTEAEKSALEEIEADADRVRDLDIADDEVVFDLGGREYYASLDEFDHLHEAAELDLPRLVLQGGRDFQVTVDDDLSMWESTLEGEPTAEIVVHDELNHRFQRGDGAMTPTEYSEPENPLDEVVVDDLVTFVDTIDTDG